MEAVKLEAKTRTQRGRKTNALRDEGSVPGIVYGFDKEPILVTIDRNAFVKTYKQAGESALVDLAIDGKDSVKVLIHELQFDPMGGFVSHADFRRIDMDKPIETSVKLVFTGSSAAVRELGGTLVEVCNSIEIRALPKDLISLIEVDITPLATFSDAVHVSELKLPPGIEALDAPTQVVATVAAPRDEAELASLDQAVEENVENVEVSGKKKEEEGEAGEEAAAEESKNESKKEPKKKE